MTRVTTYASNQVMLRSILDLQSRLNDSALAVNTERKTQTYSGLAPDAFRLVNLETLHTATDNYNAGNKTAEVRVQAASTAVENARKSVADFLGKLQDFAKFRTDTPTPEYLAQITSIRQQAVQTMANVQYYMNSDIDGMFLFSGGKTDTAPVSLPTSSLSTFEAMYNGGTVTFPETRASTLFNADFRDLKLQFSNRAAFPTATESRGAIEMDTGAGETKRFITGSLNNAAPVTYATTVPDPVAGISEGSLSSTTFGAFSTLERGMTLLINSGTAANDGVYTVTEVSQDGRYVKVTPPPAAVATDAASGYTINIGVPNGAAMAVENSTGNNTATTVRWPSNAVIPPADMAKILNGELIYTTPTFGTTGAQTNVNVVSSGYYQGDTLAMTHRVDANRTVSTAVTAQDGAFEKVFRALGLLGQGMPNTGNTANDMQEFYRRLDQTVTLLGDSMTHGNTVREDSNDMTSVQTTLGLTQVELKNAQTNARSFLSFLEGSIADIANVDLTTAVTKLNDDQRALEAAYRVLAQTSKLSLKDYI